MSVAEGEWLVDSILIKQEKHFQTLSDIYDDDDEDESSSSTIPCPLIILNFIVL